MDMQVVVDILKNIATKDQLRQFLEDVTAANYNGYCPICYEHDVPVDKQGNVIEGDDVSDADEFQERHDEHCPVTLIERYLAEQEVKQPLQVDK